MRPTEKTETETDETETEKTETTETELTKQSKEQILEKLYDFIKSELLPHN